MSARPPQPETGYVIVTVADNGVIHAWGHPATGDPFAEQSKARTEVARMRRRARRDYPEYSDVGVVYRVCKLLSDPDQDGTNAALRAETGGGER